MTESEVAPPLDCFDRIVDSRVARWFYYKLNKIFLFICLVYLYVYLYRKSNRACLPEEVVVRLNATHVRWGNTLFAEAGPAEEVEGDTVDQPQMSAPQTWSGPGLEAPKQPIFPGPGEKNHPYLNRKAGSNYTELMEVTPPPFLANYKNPCWLEEMSDPLVYNGNVFYEDDQYKEYFWMMERKLAERVAAGKRWRVRCFPYFFVAGFPKCGTTDLYDKLTLHPDIAVGAAKEPQYWSRWRVGWTEHGYTPISQYLDMYDNAAMQIEDHIEDKEQLYHNMIHGDGSVNTVWENHWWGHLPDSTKNASGPHFLTSDYIHHIHPDARIIVILRDPITRLYSDYLFFNSHQQKSVEDFHNQTVRIISAFRQCFAERSMRDCMVDFTLYTINDVHPKEGLYSVFLEDWLRLFPREQLYVTRLEDFAADRLGVLNQIYQFLGLRPLPDYIASTVNELDRAAYEHVEAGPMLPETRTLIQDFYRPYNERLVTLLHDHKFLWQ